MVRVVKLDNRKRIEVLKNVGFNEEFFQGHFPHPLRSDR